MVGGWVYENFDEVSGISFPTLRSLIQAGSLSGLHTGRVSGDAQ